MKALRWLVNLFMYCAHLDAQRYTAEYEPYDFSKDWR